MPPGLRGRLQAPLLRWRSVVYGEACLSPPRVSSFSLASVPTLVLTRFEDFSGTLCVHLMPRKGRPAWAGVVAVAASAQAQATWGPKGAVP